MANEWRSESIWLTSVYLLAQIKELLCYVIVCTVRRWRQLEGIDLIPWRRRRRCHWLRSACTQSNDATPESWRFRARRLLAHSTGNNNNIERRWWSSSRRARDIVESESCVLPERWAYRLWARASDWRRTLCSIGTRLLRNETIVSCAKKLLPRDNNYSFTCCSLARLGAHRIGSLAQVSNDDTDDVSIETYCVQGGR